MPDMNAAILEQLVKQNQLLEAQFTRQNQLLSEQLTENKKIRWESWTTRREVEILRRAVSSPILDEVEEFARHRQLGFISTIEAIRDHKLSFARFGDGELQMMLREDYKLAFQRNSPELRAALRGVLADAATNDALLIGFPHVHRDVQWSTVWADIWGQVRELFAPIRSLGNTHVSRPAFFRATGQAGVDAWKTLWDGREVQVVAGVGSRFDLVPALFDNAARITFVDSVPKDGFADVARLADKIASSPADLTLTALGPAGTILASELSKVGKQTIDVGHISASYENVFEGGAWPEQIALTR